MILNYLEKFRSSPCIVTSNKSLTYEELMMRVHNFSNKILKLKFYKEKIFALNLEDSLELVVAYLACIELKIGFLPLGQHYSSMEKKNLINITRPNYIIKKNSIDYLTKKKTKLKNFGIFFTSGTTSEPKAILHAHQSLIQNALAFNRLNKIKKGNFLQVFPMSYMAGFLNSTLCPLLAGSKIIISKKIPNYNLINFWSYIESYKIDYTWLSPSIINFLNEMSAIDLKRNKFLKKIFVGTAPFHLDEKKKFFKNFRIYPLESYGSTEMLLVSCSIDKKKGSGKLLTGVEINLSRSRELLIKSKYKFKGTFRDNKFQKNTKIYFSSGDIGKLQNDDLILLDRKKEIIIKDGLNISPKYIEDKIKNINGVKEVAIVGKKNNKTLNEQIVCFLKVDKKKWREKIENQIYDKLSKVHWPNKFIYLNKFTKNKIGKIQKTKLLEKNDNRN